MTIEKVCFVTPSDIVALRLACGKCGRAVTVPVSGASRLSQILEAQCACGEQPGFGKDTRELKEVALFGSLLANLEANLKGRNLQLSLQMACPE